MITMSVREKLMAGDIEIRNPPKYPTSSYITRTQGESARRDNPNLEVPELLLIGHSQLDNFYPSLVRGVKVENVSQLTQLRMLKDS